MQYPVKEQINFKNDISLYDFANISMFAIWLIAFFTSFCSIWIYILGTTLVFYSTLLYFYVSRVKNWVKTPCKVFHISTKTYHLLRLFQRTSTIVHIPHVSYEYSIDGKTYTQHSIQATKRDAWFSDKSNAYTFVQKLTRKKDTKAFVNPKDPKEAVLFQEISGTTFFHILGAFLCGSFPMLIGVVYEMLPYLLKYIIK